MYYKNNWWIDLLKINTI